TEHSPRISANYRRFFTPSMIASERSRLSRQSAARACTRTGSVSEVLRKICREAGSECFGISWRIFHGGSPNTIARFCATAFFKRAQRELERLPRIKLSNGASQDPLYGLAAWLGISGRNN